MNTLVISSGHISNANEQVKTPQQRLTHYMRSQPTWLVILLPALLAVAMGLLDHLTTWEVSLFVFYAFPVVIAAWWIGIRSGMVMSVFCGLVWWLANQNTHPYETMIGYAWATISRVIFFGVVGYAVTAVRNKQEADTERIEALEERRQLEADLVAVSEHEQQRIGQDLHDGLCQHLAAIGLAARSLANDLETSKLGAARDADMIQKAIQEAVNEARGLARGIFPVHVDRHGLAVALGELAQITMRLTGVRIEVRDFGDTQISPPEAAMHLYRIAQEAVANAVRHGGAENVTIQLEGEQGLITLSVSDDGKGISLVPGAAGMGLRTMRYRAQTLGAHFEIHQREAGGTLVRCVVPVNRD